MLGAGKTLLRSVSSIRPNSSETRGLSERLTDSQVSVDARKSRRAISTPGIRSWHPGIGKQCTRAAPEGVLTG
eukprot:1500281-Alexandrium_andersonii.AAC.1